MISVSQITSDQVSYSSVQSSHSVTSNSLPPMDCSMPGFLSITYSQSLLRLLSIESVMPSNHLILCCHFSFCLQSFLASGSFPVSQLFTSGGQTIGAFASVSVLPMYIQGWFPLGLTGLISLWSMVLSKGLSLLPFFPLLFAMKWWDWMLWS